MEFFDLETEFTSGKYAGKTLEEVFNSDPKFVEQMLISNESFNISDETMVQLKEINPKFEFSERALDKREEKFDLWEDENDVADDDEDDFYDEDLEEFDNFVEEEEDDFKAKGSGKKDYDDFDDDFGGDFDDDFSTDFGDDFDDDDF